LGDVSRSWLFNSLKFFILNDFLLFLGTALKDDSLRFVDEDVIGGEVLEIRMLEDPSRAYSLLRVEG
jgi:hypothetical protein